MDHNLTISSALLTVWGHEPLKMFGIRRSGAIYLGNDARKMPTFILFEMNGTIFFAQSWHLLLNGLLILPCLKLLTVIAPVLTAKKRFANGWRGY